MNAFQDNSKLANVEIAVAPIVPLAPMFAVKVLEPIQFRRHFVKPGDFVLVDPDAPIKEGSFVLVGLRLEPWSGQQRINGVASMVWSDDV